METSQLCVAVFHPAPPQKLNDYLAAIGGVEVFAGCWIFRDNRPPGEITVRMNKLIDNTGGKLLIVPASSTNLACYGCDNWQSIYNLFG
jgi:hypothetical protein